MHHNVERSASGSADVNVVHYRSHDNYVTGKNGFLEPAPGSKYASQQIVFDDLGHGVLQNAFQGQRPPPLAVDSNYLIPTVGLHR